MQSTESSKFDTSFGMLHSLTTFKSECERIVNRARHSVSNVAEGLRSGGLANERAVEILEEVDVELAKLAR